MTNIRYFLETFDGEHEEVERETYEAVTEYHDEYTQEHTVFWNGVDQVCHTKVVEELSI